jgi:hypothetical protein
MKSFTSRVTLRALLTAREVFVGIPLPRVLPLPFRLSERCSIGICGGSASVVNCSGGLSEPFVDAMVGDGRLDNDSGLTIACAVGTGFRSGTLDTGMGIWGSCSVVLLSASCVCSRLGSISVVCRDRAVSANACCRKSLCLSESSCIHSASIASTSSFLPAADGKTWSGTAVNGCTGLSPVFSCVGNIDHGFCINGSLSGEAVVSIE